MFEKMKQYFINQAIIGQKEWLPTTAKLFAANSPKPAKPQN
jgi:hypothetical protein